jgi:hypothetical protein
MVRGGGDLFLPCPLETANLRQPMPSQSRSYLTTDGQPVSLSWYEATIWDPQPIFFLTHGICVRTAAVPFFFFLLWSAPFDERLRKRPDVRVRRREVTEKCCEIVMKHAQSGTMIQI